MDYRARCVMFVRAGGGRQLSEKAGNCPRITKNPSTVSARRIARALKEIYWRQAFSSHHAAARISTAAGRHILRGTHAAFSAGSGREAAGMRGIGNEGAAAGIDPVCWSGRLRPPAHSCRFGPDFLAAYHDIRLEVSLSDVRVDLWAVRRGTSRFPYSGSLHRFPHARRQASRPATGAIACASPCLSGRAWPADRRSARTAAA